MLHFRYHNCWCKAEDEVDIVAQELNLVSVVPYQVLEKAAIAILQEDLLA